MESSGSDRKKTTVIRFHRPVMIFWLLIAGCAALFGCQQTPVLSPTVESQKTSTPENSAVIHLANGDWAPYTGKSLPHFGCDSWAITEAFALEGITVEYDFFPWARGYNLAADGALDGALEWGDTNGRRELFYISDDFTSLQEWVFFYLKSQPFSFSSMNDLKGKTIGITFGYTYSDSFQALFISSLAKFQEASSDEANFHKLLAGRIDLFLMEQQVGKAILARDFTADEASLIAASPKPFEVFHPRLLLSKAVPLNQERMALFNAGWNKLKESGRYDEIMRACTP